MRYINSLLLPLPKYPLPPGFPKKIERVKLTSFIMTAFFRLSHVFCVFSAIMKGVLLKAGPQPSGLRPTAPYSPGGPVAWWPSPDFPQFFCPAVNPRMQAQICLGFGRAKWTTVSLNSFTILIIISVLFDPFFCCMLLSEKCCHSLFIRLFT